MRKKIITPVHEKTAPLDQEWLDLESLAEVEVTSEDPAHPIEFALLPTETAGWRAGEAGKQSIRLIFGQPQRLTRIWLHFEDSATERAQEYVLRWSADSGRTFSDIVRQQWNFSPQGATSEIENHRVNLSAVTVLELNIVPDRGGNTAFASLQQLRLA